MPFSRNTLLTIILFAVVLLAAAYYLFGAEQDDLGVVQETAVASDVELRFLSLASSVQPLRLDTALLTDQRFTRLIDIRTRVSVEAEGRANPFAPL